MVEPCLSAVLVTMFPRTQVSSETLGVLAKLLERTGWVLKEDNQSHMKKLSSLQVPDHCVPLHWMSCCCFTLSTVKQTEATGALHSIIQL